MAKESQVQPYQKLDPKIVTWIESEAFALKVMGFSYEKIQNALHRAAAGEIPSRVPLPDADFPLPFSLSLEEVHEAFKRGAAREPKLSNEEWVAVDNRRSEEAILNLQVAIHDDDPDAIDAATRVRDHYAKVNGCIVPPSLRLQAEVTLKQTEDEQEKERATEILRSMTPLEHRIARELYDRGERRAAAIHPELWPSSKDANGKLVENSSYQSADGTRAQEILQTLAPELEQDVWVETIVRAYFTSHYGRSFSAEQVAAALEFSLERIVLALEALDERRGDIRDLGTGQFTSTRSPV